VLEGCGPGCVLHMTVRAVWLQHLVVGGNHPPPSPLQPIDHWAAQQAAAAAAAAQQQVRGTRRISFGGGSSLEDGLSEMTELDEGAYHSSVPFLDVLLGVKAAEGSQPKDGDAADAAAADPAAAGATSSGATAPLSNACTANGVGAAPLVGERQSRSFIQPILEDKDSWSDYDGSNHLPSSNGHVAGLRSASASAALPSYQQQRQQVQQRPLQQQSSLTERSVSGASSSGSFKRNDDAAAAAADRGSDNPFFTAPDSSFSRGGSAAAAAAAALAGDDDDDQQQQQQQQQQHPPAPLPPTAPAPPTLSISSSTAAAASAAAAAQKLASVSPQNSFVGGGASTSAPPPAPPSSSSIPPSPISPSRAAAAAAASSNGLATLHAHAPDRSNSGALPAWMWPQGRSAVRGSTTEELTRSIATATGVDDLQRLARGLLAERNDWRAAAQQWEQAVHSLEGQVVEAQAARAGLSERIMAMERQMVEMRDDTLVDQLVAAKLVAAQLDMETSELEVQLQQERERSRQLATRLTALQERYETLANKTAGADPSTPTAAPPQPTAVAASTTTPDVEDDDAPAAAAGGGDQEPSYWTTAQVRRMLEGRMAASRPAAGAAGGGGNVGGMMDAGHAARVHSVVEPVDESMLSAISGRVASYVRRYNSTTSA